MLQDDGKMHKLHSHKMWSLALYIIEMIRNNLCHTESNAAHPTVFMTLNLLQTKLLRS